MPGSDISRLSFAGQPKSDMASEMARDSANREISRRVNEGLLDRNDGAAIRREWKDIYRLEYYRYYASLVVSDQSERIVRIAVPVTNKEATKFWKPHAPAHFSKTNLFVRSDNWRNITVGQMKYPFDSEVSLETKEAFLEHWPGPFDREGTGLKEYATIYLDTLLRHDSQRKITYCNNDGHRRTIIELLIQLLHRNGFIDASSITRLILGPNVTDIQKDDGGKKLETLEKYLLSGKRSDAIKHAKSKKLWDHALCLTFLDRYQPSHSGKFVKIGDGTRLKDDPIVQSNDEFIASLEDKSHLKIVYRSLLNRILLTDPASIHTVKHHKVFEDHYQFALLSANDCEMEYDQTNEIFRLVNAIKKLTHDPDVAHRHLISLGLTTTEFIDPNKDDLSFRSHLSFAQSDTFSTRTLILSSIELLILNEIWEYTLNLARKPGDQYGYSYIMDLVPYKIVFASRLLDLGKFELFSHYLASIKRALKTCRGSHPQDETRDQYYDWSVIQDSVDYLSRIRKDFQISLGYMEHGELIMPPQTPTEGSYPYTEFEDNNFGQNVAAALEPIAAVTQVQPRGPAAPLEPVATAQATPHFDTWTPPQGYHLPSFQDYSSPLINNSMPETIPEEVSDFNPEPETPVQSIPHQFSQGQYTHTQNSRFDASRKSDSSNYDRFRNDAPRHDAPRLDNSRYEASNYESPSQEAPKHEQQSRHEHLRGDFSQSNSLRNDDSRRGSYLENDSHDVEDGFVQNNGQDSMIKSPQSQQVQGSTASTSAGVKSSQSQSVQGQSANTSTGNSNDPQQTSIFANLASGVSRFLPKSNSKQMILPDDSKKALVFDEERNRWIDTTNPQGEDSLDISEPPPMAPVTSPVNYSFAPKSTKTRYPMV